MSTDRATERPTIGREVFEFIVALIGLGFLSRCLDFHMYLYFPLYSVAYGILAREIWRGYYLKEDLENIKKQGLESRKKIEEIEFIALTSAFLYVIYLTGKLGFELISKMVLYSSLPAFMKSLQDAFIWKLTFFIASIWIIMKWKVQNQHNIKLLGDLDTYNHEGV